MHKPVWTWSLFRRLGVKPRRSRRPAGLKARNLRFEALAPREMLAGGVLLSGFYGDGTHLVVEYGVVGEEAEPFAVAVYRSADGVAAEGLLARVEVRDAADLRPGAGHRLALQAAFADIESDYTLVAKIEGAEQAGQAAVFQDASPQDTRRFEGGVFVAADGTLYVHGTAGEDRVAVALADSGGIRVGLNDVWYA